MDPFVEKDLIECLKAISSTLNNIDSRLEELTQAVREISFSEEDEEDEDFGEPIVEDEKLSLADEDEDDDSKDSEKIEISL